ncbi:MAG: hypothetical protein JRN19_04840 [Nitrososphaerota archaeon]|nr:hypothetical protein [Nitrososphaerota archaeon]MDG7051759.1 hypothetical protein [Nitrososphaerota archaeon]
MKTELKVLSATMIVGGVMMILLTFSLIGWYIAVFSIIFIDSVICILDGLRQNRTLIWVGSAGIIISFLTIGYFLYGGSAIFPLVFGVILVFVGLIMLRK